MKGYKKGVKIGIVGVSENSAKIIHIENVSHTCDEIKYQEHNWFIDSTDPSYFDKRNNPVILLDLKGKKIEFFKTSKNAGSPKMDGQLIGNKIILHLAKASLPLAKSKFSWDNLMMYILLFISGVGVGLAFPSFFGGN